MPGLEIVEKVGQLKQPDGRALQARVGIATGLEITPNQRKDETLAILEDLLLAGEDGPVLLLLEDAIGAIR